MSRDSEKETDRVAATPPRSAAGAGTDTTVIPSLSDADQRLLVAAGAGDAKAVRAALGAGARVNIADRRGPGAALRRSALRGHRDAVCELLRAGADPRCVDVQEVSSIPLRALLVRQRAKCEQRVSAVRSGERTVPPAFPAAKRGPVRKAAPRAAVAAAAAPTKPTGQGNPERMMNAVREGDISVVQEELQAGVDVHARDDAALVIASYHGHCDIVKLLLDMGADVHASDQWGPEAALRHAAFFGWFGIAEELLQRGADVELRPEILTDAIERGKLDIVKLLLEFGVDPNLPDVSGAAGGPLRVAADVGNAQVAALLLKHGADPAHVEHDRVRTERVRELLQAARRSD